MISDSEYTLIVDELRDDPAFVDLLTTLRGRLSLALSASHPKERKQRYASVADCLRVVFERLEARR